jgi:LysR family transcriptional regulator, transcriptional activator of nhaA
MQWLNYHHLMYFWVVAREGSIMKACDVLQLAQPTISSQLRALEQSVGVQLFQKQGRNLVLTDAGRTVFRYADGIFSLGRELQDALRGNITGKALPLMVGISESMPKLIAHRLLEPVLRMEEPVQLICTEGRTDQLLSQLAVHDLDVVLSDVPVNPSVKVRAFNHLLGECGVTVCGTPELVAQYKKDFPKSLHQASMLLPMNDTSMRRSLELWFDDHGIVPRVVGEFTDSALLKTFGQAGAGIFFIPSAIEPEVAKQFDVQFLGRIDSIKERFYIISAERKLKHPTLAAIAELARQKLFD